jgi:DNA-binding transcriptional ArsR family regulator
MKASDFVFKLKADFLAALANPARLRILEHLRKGEASVGSLGKELQVPQPSVSKHLAILKQEGLVQSRQVGATVYCRVADQDIYHVLAVISGILKKKVKESQKALEELGKERR